MDELLLRAEEALSKLRSERPLVLCLTNTVAENFTANVLLALGATPAMIHDPEEAAELASKAGAVLVNVGTVTHSQADAMRAAIVAANAAGVPWVLDPVAADRLSFRGGLVREFLQLKPTLVRGNAREMKWVGDCGDIVTLATGPVDRVGDWTCDRGHPLLSRVTATGCAQGAVAAAFCAVEKDARVAAVGAARVMALAGEMAVKRAQRPGSFQIALLDALDDVHVVEG